MDLPVPDAVPDPALTRPPAGHGDHVTSPATYLVIFGALLALTVTTVAVAAAPLGAWHTPVAFAIAAVKATLVVLFFMHVLHSTRLTWVVVLASLFMLGIMFALTFSDYLTRAWMMY
jgi:cytochrome c oxidase subunit 4